MIILHKIKILVKSQEGSVLPLIMAVVSLSILLGAYNIGLSFIYKDRAIIRDAVDSAVLSSLSGGTEEKSVPTYYYETYHEDEENIEDKWKGRDKDEERYIYLDKELAESIALEYFNRLLEENGVKYRLIDWDYDYIYDQQRIIKVIKDREYFEDPSSWWIDDNLYYNDKTNEEEKWNPRESYEEKNIRFPRWVQATLKVKVEIPIPMGKIFNNEHRNWETITISWSSGAAQEISDLD